MKSILLLSTLASLTLSAHAADWPHWRGPDRNGISSEKSIQTQWKNDEPAILWKANVGTGYSAISIANGSVVTLGNDAGKETVYCFDEATGKEKWKHTYDSPLAPKYFPGGPTSTPTIDGAHVYTLSREGQLFCFDLTTGKVVWAENPAKDNEMSKPEWGFSGSPMILGDRLYLNVGDAGMALNKKDGSVIWKSGTGAAGYSTLLPMNHSGKTALLLGSAKSYLAVDADNGKELWRHKWATKYGVNASDPIISGNKIFISSGYKEGCALLDLSTASKPQEIWKNSNLMTQMNPAVLIDGHLYGIDGNNGDKNPLRCVNLETGKIVWEEPGIGTGGVTATADGQLIVLSSRGELSIAPATPKGFDPVARGQVFGGTSWTVPVLANGRIYCRNSKGDIACVDVKK